MEVLEEVLVVLDCSSKALEAAEALDYHSMVLEAAEAPDWTLKAEEAAEALEVLEALLEHSIKALEVLMEEWEYWQDQRLLLFDLEEVEVQEEVEAAETSAAFEAAD